MPIIGTGIFGFGEFHFCSILDRNIIYLHLRDDGDFVSISADDCKFDILTNIFLFFTLP